MGHLDMKSFRFFLPLRTMQAPSHEIMESSLNLTPNPLHLMLIALLSTSIRSTLPLFCSHAPHLGKVSHGICPKHMIQCGPCVSSLVHIIYLKIIWWPLESVSHDTWCHIISLIIWYAKTYFHCIVGEAEFVHIHCIVQGIFHVFFQSKRPTVGLKFVNSDLVQLERIG